MLHRSFKPAKCKTSLKLAASRIKLLKNKREAQVKHLKRELAQLLESGQDQTARIRVEHVVREEKTMAAYDLLEIYCELIVARLPIIESQKNCPIDLKEAISSVIFASPRCADIPELMDVRKHFTAKYGKEFVSAAVELRPDCGVSRLLVEKLSAKAPDGPTKIKILSAIAEEHNIQWDPKSFGEKDSKPSEDLLNGPNTFGNASQMYANPSYARTPPGCEEDKGPSNFQVPPKSNEKHDVPVNLHEHNARPSPGSQTDTDTHQANFSAAFHPHPESMASASDTERMGRHKWNMEFKDATAAAHAAAESAERASMAARAAAELSSRGNTRHYSAESQRDEESHRYAVSRLQSEYHAKGPVNVALDGRNSGMDYEQISGTQQYDVMAIGQKFHGDSFKSINKSSQSASLKSSGAAMDGDPSVNNLPMADRYFRKNSSELGQGDHFSQGSFKKQSSKSEVDYENKLREGQGSFKKQSSRSEVDYVNKQQEGLNPKNFGGFEVASNTSSPSGSGMFSDDHAAVSNFNSQSFGGDDDENPFAVNNMGNILRNSNKSSSPENATVVFDDYCSDQDECEIDLEGKQKEHKYFDFASHGRKSPTHLFANTNAWSERKTVDESMGISAPQTHFSMEHHYDPVFSESLPSSTGPSHPDDMLPANFDDSDASISENEEELEKSKLIRSKDTNRSNVYSRTSEVIQDDHHGFADSSFADKGNEGSSQPWSQSSSFNRSPVEVHSGRDQGSRVNAGSAGKFGYGDVATSQSSPRFTASNYDPDSYNQQVDEEMHQKSQQPSRFSMGHEDRGNVVTPPPVEATEDIETLKESSLESGTELNFANLTGGLRNKGYKRPQYVTSPAQNASSSKQTAEDSSAKIEESLSATVKVSSSTGARSQDPYSREVRTESDGRPSSGAHFGSYDNDSYYELPQRTSTSSQERDSEKAGIEENKRSRSRPQVKYFDSTDSDSEDDFPKEALTSKPHLNPVFSRRTKASSAKSEKSSYSKTTVFSEDSGSSGCNEERSYPSRNTYSTQNRQKRLSENKSSGLLGISEKPKLVEEPASKPIQESKRSFFEQRSARQSNPFPNRVTSGSSSTESLKTSSGDTQIPSKEKASHVHPKLPDYDAISAHLQSLRKNRP